MKRNRHPDVPRTWRVPPAILRGPGETIDRIGILDEHDPDAALLLWRTARDVELWAATPPPARAALFTPGAAPQRERRIADAALDGPVAEDVRAIARILADPGSAARAEAAERCLAVAHWARATGRPQTALAFAQAGALAAPEMGAAALVTGLCAAEMGQGERGHTWLLRAVAVSRRGRQAEAYTGAHLALGHHFARQGSAGAARRSYLRALRGARRWALPAERAGAAYGLFRLALADGDAEAASEHGKAAMVAARRLPPELTPFGTELAAFWIAVRRPLRALRTLARLEPALTTAEERLGAAVLRVRAALDVRDAEQARRGWTHAWRIVQEEAVADAAAVRALLALARAAARLGDAPLLSRAGRAALARVPADAFAATQAELHRLGLRAEAAVGEEAA